MGPIDKDQFDDLLDGALKRYGNVEPRAGLEGRVLARLAVEASRAQGRAWWVWGLAGAAAMFVVIGTWIGIGHRRPATPGAVVQQRVPEAPRRKTAVVIPPIELNKPAAVGVRRQSPAPVTRANAAGPRLEQFPSPRPLSQQEELLIAYVTEFPKQAAEVAQEQREREKEFEAMYPATSRIQIPIKKGEL